MAIKAADMACGRLHAPDRDAQEAFLVRLGMMRVHECRADSDRLNAPSGSNLLPAEAAPASQWREPPL